MPSARIDAQLRYSTKWLVNRPANHEITLRVVFPAYIGARVRPWVWRNKPSDSHGLRSWAWHWLWFEIQHNDWREWQCPEVADRSPSDA